MKTKKCKICLIDKNYSEFNVNNTYKDNHSNFCKKCTYFRNKEKTKEYRIKNKKYIKERDKEYREREEVKVRMKEWREKNKEKNKIYHKEYRIKNYEKKRAVDKLWRQNNADRKKEVNREYFENNRSKIYSNLKERRKKDIKYNISIKLRNRIYFCIRRIRYKSKKRTIEVLGADFDTVKTHLESLFKEGMSWDKILCGEIHIDHIIPLASANSIEELYDLCHYKNLQPLWAEDNLRKGDKIL